MRSADDIFHDAREIADPAARADFLDEACKGDAGLRSKVDQLLRADAELGGFLASRDCELTTLDPVTLSERPGSRIGPYKLLQVIGEGGFGTVFLAEQSEPVRRKVAVKVIKLGMDSRQVIARFEAERQALAVMNHPHIARVFDGGVTDSGRPYFVMEYVVGEAITQYSDTNTLSVAERLELFRQVCAAVQHAHTKGIIHRDLKPANVLVSMVDGKPYVKVIDFGIAKATASPLTDKTLFTEHRQLIGTPEYMSPEQAEGSPDIDTRTDVYALGVLLYELLTGLTPLDGKRLRSAAYGEMQRIIKEEEPLAPSLRLTRSPEILAATAAHRRTEPDRLGPQVRGELDWIVMKALDKDRGRRYESAAQLATDIGNHLAGDAVVAAPPSRGYRARKYVRRNKEAVIATTAVFGVFAIGLISTIAALRVAQHNAKAAIHNADLVTAARDELQSTNAKLEAQAEQARAGVGEMLSILSDGVAGGLVDSFDPETGESVFEQNPLGATVGMGLDLARSLKEERDISAWSAYTANLFAAASEPYLMRERLSECPAELRGWEWDYLQAISDTSTTTIHATESPNTWWTSQVSEDGSYALTLSNVTDDGVAWDLWDTETGQLVRTLSDTNQHIPTQIELSPDKDTLALSGKNMISFWSMSTGDRLGSVVANNISNAHYSPDGRAIAGSGPANQIFVWDTSSGQLLMESPTYADYERAYTSFVTWAPDSQHIITDAIEHRAAIYDISTGTVIRYLSGHTDEVLNGEFSPDGQRIVTGSEDGSARIWDAETGECLAILSGHPDAVRVSISADGSKVLTSSWKGDGRIWELDSGRMLCSFDGGEPGMLGGHFSPDGSMVLTTAGPSGKLWDTYSGKLIATLTGHNEYIYGAAFTPSGSQIVTTSWDGTTKLWDSRTSTHTSPTMLTSENYGCESVEFSQDGSTALTSTVFGDMEVWDIQNRSLLASFTHDDKKVENEYAPARRRWLTSDGSRVISCGRQIRIWDTRKGTEVRTDPLLALLGELTISSCDMDEGRDRLAAMTYEGDITVYDMTSDTPVRTMASPGSAYIRLSPDGTLLAIVSHHQRSCRIVHIDSGTQLAEIKGDDDTFDAVTFSPSSQSLVTSSSHAGQLVLWDSATGDLIAPLGIAAGAGAQCTVEFSEDGSMIAFTSGKDVVIHHLQRVETQTALKGHAGRVLDIAFHPTGTRIATCSDDTTVRIWDTEMGRCLAVFRVPPVYENELSHVEFSPDGSLLIVASYEGPAYIFDAKTARIRDTRLSR